MEGQTSRLKYLFRWKKFYRKDWYDLDAKRAEIKTKKDENEEKRKKIEEDEKQGKKLTDQEKEPPHPNLPNIPDCTTAEMVDVLEGHLSLSHANYGNESSIMETTGEKVGVFKENMLNRLQTITKFNETSLNKYRQSSYKTFLFQTSEL